MLDQEGLRFFSWGSAPVFSNMQQYTLSRTAAARPPTPILGRFFEEKGHFFAAAPRKRAKSGPRRKTGAAVARVYRAAQWFSARSTK